MVFSSHIKRITFTKCLAYRIFKQKYIHLLSRCIAYNIYLHFCLYHFICQNRAQSLLHQLAASKLKLLHPATLFITVNPFLATTVIQHFRFSCWWKMSRRGKWINYNRRLRGNIYKLNENHFVELAPLKRGLFQYDQHKLLPVVLQWPSIHTLLDRCSYTVKCVSEMWSVHCNLSAII